MGRGRSFDSSSVKRRRSKTDGRGLASAFKSIAKFAAKNAPTILKGVRYLSKKSGNKTLQSIAKSKLLDQGADYLSDKFKGRGVRSSTRKQAKTLVNKMIRLYGRDGTRKILASYMRANGRGVIGKVLANILGSILPF